MRYPHMDNRPDSFPHIDNVDVFKYENTFNYERYNATQMQLCMCTVPWDMGEAHIGNRTISGIGNVVYFENETARDAWFDAIPDDKCYRFETKYKELHSSQTLDVEVPFDVCARYNYVTVQYNLFANDDSPVKFETEDGLRKWFWFIRSVEFIAPNTTRLHIMLDAWQTFIYGFDITGMILERGHAPMFAMSADEYLSNPIENCADLLTEDVNFGRTMQVRNTSYHVFNDDVVACIATSADPRANWGSKDAETWHTPAAAHYTIQGATSTMVIALDAGDLNTFLGNVETYAPQFKQTVLAVWFAPRELVSLSYPFMFCNVTCYIPNASRKGIDFVDIEKSQFGYPDEYADIAKLYTMPYAHIEITDERGETVPIAIEDTTGTIDISAGVNLVWPYVTIDAHLMGVGGVAGSRLTFANVSAKSFSFSGKWYDYLYTWQVPTFAVIMQASDVYDYATDFDRKQRVIDYTTVYDNTVDSADTALSNANDSADTAKENAYRSANTVRTNELAVQAGLILNKDDTKTTATLKVDTYGGGTISPIAGSGGYLGKAYDAQLDKLSDDTDADQILMYAMTGIATGNIAASAVVNAGGSIGGGVASGAMTGSAFGPIGAAAGGAVGGIAQAAQVSAGTVIALTNEQSICDENINHSRRKFNSARDNAMALTQAQIDYNHDCKDADNALLESTVKRFSDSTDGINPANIRRTRDAAIDNADDTNETDKNNALATRNTAVVNAGRDRQRAIDDIANDIKQAALRAPEIFGQFANGEHATTKPIALFAHVVTQDKHAIKCAGDEFSRYGYRLDNYWEFDGNWNIGKHFTYWKLRDFWVSNLNTPDMYADSLRFFLFGGVTVWRNPDEIGKVSLYDNWPVEVS